MQTGVSLFGYYFPSVRALTDLGAEFDAAGVRHLFVTESSNDIVAPLAALAVTTHQAALGSAIATIALRHPFQTAMAAAHIDALSGGRFTLGLGVGGGQGPWYGLEAEKPLGRMRDYLEVVKKTWEQGAGPTDVRNTRYQVTGPRPHWPPSRRIPVVLAALSGGLATLAATDADGIITSLATLEQIRACRRLLDATPTQAGEAFRRKTLYAVIHVVIRDTREAALAVMRDGAVYAGAPHYQRQFERAGLPTTGNRLTEAAIDAVAIAGPLPHARERLTAFAEAGVDVALLTVAFSEVDRIGAYRQLLPLLT